MTLLKNVLYLKENLKHSLGFKMKNKVLLYKDFKGKWCIVLVEKLPFWKRIIYRKKFDIKAFDINIFKAAQIN